jgi:hypothetical protein
MPTEIFMWQISWLLLDRFIWIFFHCKRYDFRTSYSKLSTTSISGFVYLQGNHTYIKIDHPAVFTNFISAEGQLLEIPKAISILV